MRGTFTGCISLSLLLSTVSLPFILAGPLGHRLSPVDEIRARERQIEHILNKNFHHNRYADKSFGPNGGREPINFDELKYRIEESAHIPPFYNLFEDKDEEPSRSLGLEDLGPLSADTKLPKPEVRSSDLISVHVNQPEDEEESEDTNDENSDTEHTKESLYNHEDKVKTGSYLQELEHHHAAPVALAQSQVQAKAAHTDTFTSISDVYLLAVIAGCAVAALSGLIFAGVCWYRLHKKVKAASDVDYPAYGVTGPSKEKGGSPGDRKLAQSAQMYHYQHQKQQMIASERGGAEVQGGGGVSEGESEDECEEGHYTVFECPGLATTGEMEVRNPMFNDQTPTAAPNEK